MKSWYIIAYDIRHPKRLRRLHYHLRKRATALQNSVFLVKANDKYLKQLIRLIEPRINKQEDDVRVYPVYHPDTIWAAGRQVDAMSNLYAGVSKVSKPKAKTSWLKSLFGWGNDDTNAPKKKRSPKAGSKT